VLAPVAPLFLRRGPLAPGRIPPTSREIELSLFIGVMFLAIVYGWRKGVLHWK
jgi:hypothetical protein